MQISSMIDLHYGQRLTFVSTVRLYLTAIMSWNDDTMYAMTLVKYLAVPIGGWPLQEYNTFVLLRHILSSFGLVRFQFSRRKDVSSACVFKLIIIDIMNF